MIWHIYALLWVTGLGTSYYAFVAKREPLFSATVNIAVWSVIAFSSLTVRVPSNGEWLTAGSTPAAVLAAAVALISVPIAFAAAIGRYGGSSSEMQPKP